MAERLPPLLRFLRSAVLTDLEPSAIVGGMLNTVAALIQNLFT